MRQPDRQSVPDEKSAPTARRQPHAALDLPSRNWKAMKIERLLDLAHRPQPVCLLRTIPCAAWAPLKRIISLFIYRIGRAPA